MSTFTDEQIKAIEWFEGPMLVLGTPGSGKTTVIVNRISNLIYGHGVNPANILVITFTRAAAESMRARFLDMSGEETTRVRFGTFHSFFYWIIKTAYSNSVQLSVMDENSKRDVIRKILCEINKDSYDNDDSVSSVINQLGIISCDMIDIDNYYSFDISENDFRTVHKKFTEYKKLNGLLDFDDMVTECYKLLKERPDILEQVRKMYPYIMVDEYQDTNKIQYEILKLLAHPLDNLYVVGDDDQSIYGFRGARPDIMLSFEKEFPGASTIRLSYNHRCPAEIVDVSSKIIAHNKKRYEKSLKSASNEVGMVVISKVPDVTKENELICKRLLDEHSKGVAYENMAVLYRTNLSPRRLMYKLREYNIDYTVRDVIPNIFTNPVVIPVVNYITFALGNHSRELFLTFMNKPVRYISRNMLTNELIQKNELLKAANGKDYLIKNINRLFSELRTISNLAPYAAVNYIREAIGYNKYLKAFAEEHNADYDAMMDVLDEFQSMMKECRIFGEFYDFVDEYKRIIAEQNEKRLVYSNSEESKGVQLMTLHSSKGLEFSNVHILDVVEDQIPHKRSKAPRELEEERRMLYVGITRSSKNLYMYIPKILGEKVTKPSRFIEEVL